MSDIPFYSHQRIVCFMSLVANMEKDDLVSTVVSFQWFSYCQSTKSEALPTFQHMESFSHVGLGCVCKCMSLYIIL